MSGNDRCDYSDLPKTQCAHCREPGVATRPILEDPQAESGTVRWSGRQPLDDPEPNLPRRAHIKRGTDCRYDAALGYLTKEHREPCRDTECEGCKPCEPRDANGNPLNHCTNGHCTEHVAPSVLTCPRCVGRARDDLGAIADLSTLMIHEAIVAGPESEAAMLAGPSIDPIAAYWRRINQLRQDHDLLEPLDSEDPHHPLAVLGRWELMLREDYSQDYSDLPPITITGARRYLDAILDMLAQDQNQDWPLFASELRACRRHLEGVMRDSHAPERGAPCFQCAEDSPEKPAPRLVRHRRDFDQLGHPDPSGASDFWGCPLTDAHWWFEADYRRLAADHFMNHSDRLTASQIEDQYEVKQGTLRKWAHDGDVRKRGRDESGRQMYDTNDIKRMQAKQVTRVLPCA